MVSIQSQAYWNYVVVYEEIILSLDNRFTGGGGEGNNEVL